MTNHSRSDRIITALTVVAGLLAIAVGGSALVSEFGGRGNDDEVPEPRAVDGWDRLIEYGHRVGPDDARVTILAFGDYQCPACRVWHSHIRAVLRQFPTDVAFVYRHYPLPYHQLAYPAARAAECAAEQGAFWTFHDLLYTEANWFGEAVIELARTAGVVDLEGFRACTASNDPHPLVERDIRAASELDAPGTPVVLVDGLLLAAGVDSTSLATRIRDTQ